MIIQSVKERNNNDIIINKNNIYIILNSQIVIKIYEIYIINISQKIIFLF
jgi:hypothetical protein